MELWHCDILPQEHVTNYKYALVVVYYQSKELLTNTTCYKWVPEDTILRKNWKIGNFSETQLVNVRDEIFWSKQIFY